jgi:hypothetical protein
MQGYERSYGSAWHDENVTTACWDCGVVLTGASSEQDHPPDAGAASLCVYCEALNIFTGKNLEIRKPTEEEVAQYEADPDIIATRINVAKIRDEMIKRGNPRVRPREAPDAPRSP